MSIDYSEWAIENFREQLPGHVYEVAKRDITWQKTRRAKLENVVKATRVMIDGWDGPDPGDVDRDWLNPIRDALKELDE